MLSMVKEELLSEMGTFAAERARADGLTQLAYVLDRVPSGGGRLNDFEALCQVAYDTYRSHAHDAVNFAPTPADAVLKLSSAKALIEYQRNVSEYLEDEDMVWPSPLANYIWGFVNDPPVSAKVSLADDFGPLGVFASVPDYLTEEEAPFARLLALRLFGGWSLNRIASKDGIALADVRALWLRAREWGASNAGASRIVNPSFDMLDQEVMRVIARHPELIHALEWKTFERILAVTLDKIGFRSRTTAWN